MHDEDDRSDDALIQRLDASNARISREQRELFRLIKQADRRELWRGSGARDGAHWLAMRYGISEWKARRWIAAAHALDMLPRLSEAFARGELGVDKVVELARFATAETEGRLVVWARGVSSGCIRRRADVMVRRSLEEARDPDRDRFVSWWYFDEGRCFGLEAELPAADGAVVARALERLSRKLPVMPDEEEGHHVLARQADALVALCSGGTSGEADPDRVTVVAHVPLEALASADGAAELEDGGVVHAETARRLLCNARVQAVVEDGAGDVVGLGRTTREVPAWMMRQLRYRDRECRFPGCGARRYLQAHHLVWRRNGGLTRLANLILVCFFHHKLAHEYGWSIRREADGTVTWLRPDWTRYRAGPGPPEETSEWGRSLSVVGL